MYKQLYRSRTNRMLAGVCAGLGKYINVDPTIVRLVFVVIGLLGYVFPAAVVYLVLFIVAPEEPETLSSAAPAAEPPTVEYPETVVEEPTEEK